jgi:RNA polymerase-binding transcription factor DksA
MSHHLDQAFLDEARRLLTAKQEQAQAELAALETPAVDTGGISFGKRVGDGTSIAVERITQVATHDGITAELAQVRQAQAMLEAGTYGVCELCGLDIPVERLQARPWATRHVVCPQ